MEEGYAPIEHVLVLNIDENGCVEYYGARWEVVEDGVVDLAREDAAAQLRFYAVDKHSGKDIDVAPHFVQLTREAFFMMQKDHRCIVVPKNDDPTPEEYMAELKALRKEKRTGTKRKLDFEEE